MRRLFPPMAEVVQPQLPEHATDGVTDYRQKAPPSLPLQMQPAPTSMQDARLHILLPREQQQTVS